MCRKKSRSVARGIYKCYTTKSMKGLTLICVTVFSTIGSLVPMLFGDNDLLGGWSIVGGLIGGLFGIWLAVFIYRRWG